MNIYAAVALLLVFFSSVLSTKTFAQDSVKVKKYLGKKIRTVIEYQSADIDSSVKRYSNMDSLINNSPQISWETLLKYDGSKQIVAKRTLKRMQVAYLDQSNYFFDSQMPLKAEGVSIVFNEIYNKLIGRSFNEIIPVSVDENRNASNFLHKPNLYNVAPYDTTKYITSIFFFQNVPKQYRVNDNWSDTLITEKAVLINKFTIKSSSKNTLTLFFHNSLIALNYKRNNQIDSEYDGVRINVFENSVNVEGLMNIDPDTHFIYSIQATASRKMESSINDTNRKKSIVISKFSLNNKIE